MIRRRFLPKYVTSFPDRHGKERLRFRRKGFDAHYFRSALGTEEFREEYQRCLNPSVDRREEKAAIKAAKGSIDELIERYFAIPERLGPSAITQQKVTAVIEDFRRGRGHRSVATVRFEHLDAIIRRKREKSMRDTPAGPREVGGIHAARKLRKELIRLFAFAVKIKMIDHNPAEQSEKVRRPRGEAKGGFHSWTEEEIAQYRARWPIGTRERLAMELLLWTDQRRCDVVKMGKAQIKNGRIPVHQDKTGKDLWLPMAPQLLEAIIAMPPKETSPFCFLVTRFGRPFKKESFGNFFRDSCNAAGLPHCSAHGLRKATLRRMADLEMANTSMKSVSGQERDETLAEYIKGANQTKLADAAIERLSAWERGQQCLTSDHGLDTDGVKNG
jgi:integrase